MTKDIIYREYEYNSHEYSMELELRNEVLRTPIGLNLYDEDLGRDENDYHIGAFRDNELIGCLLLSKHDESTIKMRQVAVSDKFRNRGIGSEMVRFSENFIKDLGFEKITMHARKKASDFYMKLGYSIVSDEFTEVGIPHYVMTKDLSYRGMVMKKADRESMGEVSSILIEAAEWMISKGFKNWNPETLKTAKLIENYDTNEFFICYIGDEAAGCLRLQEEDELFWPGFPDDEALYIHKLAVRRKYSGNGVALFMIDWAKEKVNESKRKFLRLDCIADRKKLCEFYEKNGFTKIDEINVVEFGTSARYEAKV